MTPERKQHLYNQYVLSIANDGDWYTSAKPFLKPGSAIRFYQATYEHISQLSRRMREGTPKDKERAYIYLECWRYHGGTTDAFFFNTPTTSSTMQYAAEIVAEERATARQPVSQPEPSQEEPAVNNTTIAFETRHFVYGLDVANMSAGQLIEAIKKIEAEIADLKLVKSKSEHIKKRIAELEDMLAKVVQVLDAK